jgi:hypothetical protein
MVRDAGAPASRGYINENLRPIGPELTPQRLPEKRWAGGSRWIEPVALSSGSRCPEKPVPRGLRISADSRPPGRDNRRSANRRFWNRPGQPDYALPTRGASNIGDVPLWLWRGNCWSVRARTRSGLESKARKVRPPDEADEHEQRVASTHRSTVTKTSARRC